MVPTIWTADFAIGPYEEAIVRVVVSTSPGRETWLEECLKSLPEAPLVVTSPHFELGAIGWVLRHTSENRFLYLQDSVRVKSGRFWDLIESAPGAVAITDTPLPFGSYLGVYDRRLLERVGVPTPKTKAEAIHYELEWVRDYLVAAKKVSVMFPHQALSQRFEVVNSRLNLVLENADFVKYKGTWNRDQVDPEIDGQFPEAPARSKRNRRKIRKIVENTRFLT